MRTLSSAGTLPGKLGIVFGVAVGGPALLTGGFPLVDTLGVLLALLFCTWLWLPLKRIRIDDEMLYVSNYLKEVRIPLWWIDEVRGGTWPTRRHVIIVFSSATTFGSTVPFMAGIPWRSPFFWEPHPVVQELMDAVVSANARHQHTPGHMKPRPRPPQSGAA